MARTFEELRARFPNIVARHGGEVWPHFRTLGGTVRCKSNGKEYGLLVNEGLDILDKLKTPLPAKLEKELMLGLCGRDSDCPHNMGISNAIKSWNWDKDSATKTGKGAGHDMALAAIRFLRQVAESEKASAKPAPASRTRRTRKSS